MRNTPFDCFTSHEEKVAFFTSDLCFTSEALKARSFSLWFYIIQLDIFKIDEVVKSYVSRFPELVQASDVLGRIAIKVATRACVKAMESTFLWFGRYRLLEARPEHISATCYVYKASDDDNHGQRVALKLMKSGLHFLREYHARNNAGLSEDFVVSVISSYPNEKYIEENYHDASKFPDIADFENWGQFGNLTLTKEQAEASYCFVMPLANRNMFVSLKQDRFAGEKWDEIRLVLTQLVKCVEHLHLKGI